eukprot:TRINITY_DN6454_c0_g1_i2.p1 TRINITY_DN6454_c0_g1~~TRINITY_DN6454_c0_g1_i2.p1  ORF type:complete len:398 (+),score=84.03 TRINITY_DN6454_c0_g1_i2:1231-2424(+)
MSSTYSITAADEGSIVVGVLAFVSTFQLLVGYLLDEIRYNEFLNCRALRLKLTGFTDFNSDTAKKPTPQTLRTYRLLFAGRVLVLSLSLVYLLSYELSWMQAQSLTGCAIFNWFQGLTYYLARFFGYTFLILRLQLVATSKSQERKRIVCYGMLVLSVASLLLGLIQTGTSEVIISDYGYCDTNSTTTSDRTLFTFLLLDALINVLLLVFFIIPLRELLQLEVEKKNTSKSLVSTASEYLPVIKRNTVSCALTTVSAFIANLAFYQYGMNSSRTDLGYATNYLTIFDTFFHCVAILYTHKRFEAIALCGRTSCCSEKYQAPAPSESDAEHVPRKETAALKSSNDVSPSANRRKTAMEALEEEEKTEIVQVNVATDPGRLQRSVAESLSSMSMPQEGR